jgi:leader peptidase (prepilin peptidase)/N-methyltransferase
LPADIVTAMPVKWLAGLFGLVFGSFLNVCISRLPQHLSVVAPRSYCPQCHATIAWYDNIPLASYVILKGRCRTCRASISWRYPVVEVMTAVLFIAVIQVFGVQPEAGKWILFTSLLTVLFWTDLETRLLPEVLTLGGIVSGLALAFVFPVEGGAGDWWLPNVSPALRSVLNAGTAALVLAIPLMLFAGAYAWLRRIEPPGLGDFALLGLLGVFLGLQGGLLAMIIGSISGVVIGLSYIFGTGRDPKTEPLPFGTFLSGGGLVVVFWGPRLLRWWLNSSL